jgi:hypothetical protein
MASHSACAREGTFDDTAGDRRWFRQDRHGVAPARGENPRAAAMPPHARSDPDASVILTCRDADSRWRSYEHMILQILQRIATSDARGMPWRLVAEGAYGAKHTDRAACITRYDARVSRVKAVGPPDHAGSRRGLGDCGHSSGSKRLTCPIPPATRWTRFVGTSDRPRPCMTRRRASRSDCAVLIAGGRGPRAAG